MESLQCGPCVLLVVIDSNIGPEFEILDLSPTEDYSFLTFRSTGKVLSKGGVTWCGVMEI